MFPAIRHKEATMTAAEIHAVYHRHLTAENAHDAHAAAGTYVERGYYRVMPFGLTFTGRAAVEAQYAMSYLAFPDARFEIETEVVDGPWLFHAGTMHATATGSFFGQPPTGRPVQLPFSARIEFADGAMVGETLWYDLATLCEQVGVPIEPVRQSVAALAAQIQKGAAS
jgi:predicted ester cyclase